MRPVCKFYISSECKNPNCHFSHPKEYPVYIYAGPENDIHPDELRVNVVCDPSMAAQADRIWIENYQQFCQSSGGDVTVDIIENPDYFSRPFNVDAVSKEIDTMKREGRLAPRQDERGDRQGRGYNNNRNYDGRGYGSRGFDNRGGYRGYNDRSYDGRGVRNSGNFEGNKFGGGRFESKGDGRYSGRYEGGRDEGRGRFGGDKPYGSWGKPGMSAEQSKGRGEGEADGRSGGWFNNRQNAGGSAQNSTENGFERASGGPQPDEQSNSPEYEYKNVPYHYK